MRRVVFILIGLSLIALAAWAAIQWSQSAPLVVGPKDWPHWRGPTRDDQSKETGLLKTWPAEGPKLLWMNREIGIGYSGPAIVGHRLFTSGAIEKKEFLFCLDTDTGKKLWATEIGALFFNDYGSGPRGTASVNEDRVYMLGGRGDLVCVRADSGKIIWKVAVRDLDTRTPHWGFGESILVDGDQVVCTAGGPSGTIACFDRRNGQLRWRSKEIVDQAQYSSISPMDVEGVRQYVQVTKEHVFAVAAADGKLLWTHPFPGQTVIPTPVVRSPYVYVTAGDGSGCMLLKVGTGGSSVEQVYANKVMKNHHGGVILLGDHLYGHSDPTGWTCQEFLTGKSVWMERKAFGKGTQTFADGLFYSLEEDSGNVALVEGSTNGWREISRFKLDPQSTQRSRSGKIWTHPVISHGKLYLRDQEFQFCFDVSAKP